MEPGPSVSWTDRVYDYLGGRARPEQRPGAPWLYQSPRGGEIWERFILWGELRRCGLCCESNVVVAAWAVWEQGPLQFACNDCDEALARCLELIA